MLAYVLPTHFRSPELRQLLLQRAYIYQPISVHCCRSTYRWWWLYVLKIPSSNYKFPFLAVIFFYFVSLLSSLFYFFFTDGHQLQNDALCDSTQGYHLYSSPSDSELVQVLQQHECEFNYFINLLPLLPNYNIIHLQSTPPTVFSRLILNPPFYMSNTRMRISPIQIRLPQSHVVALRR